MPRPERVVDGREMREIDVGGRPAAAHRPYDARSNPGGHNDRPSTVPPHRSNDVRYHRPSPHSVRSSPHAYHHVPAYYTYRGWYTRWYCHPWYRYQYSTISVVSFGFAVYPWVDYWVPPARAGYVWVPGYWAYGVWIPGFWAPIGPPPAGYVYVDGWWEQDAYVDGYYRVEFRDGWSWVDGQYLDDGTYERGSWVPDSNRPDGYAWEPGFWDGEEWIDGFWRPEYRDGYLWVSSYYDDEGVFHGGYWSPLEDRPGDVWIPGWFDGNEWIEGYWIPESEINDQALQAWTPPPGVDDGWEDQAAQEAVPYVDTEDGAPPEARIIKDYEERYGEEPLAIPVVPPDAE